MKMLKNEKGFTLIELVLIIVVLGVLSAVATMQFGSVIGDSKDAAVEGAAGSVNAQLALAVNTLKALPSTGTGAGTFGDEVHAKLTISGSNISKSAYIGADDRFAICTLSAAGPCVLAGTTGSPTVSACGSTSDKFVQVSYTAGTGALAITAPAACGS